ncbi:hypothetical protein [Coxiella-like endosymbiont]|uniref:hypothetical protein n=1 Tax=Coxiella-like endosymbiont TaxID=1592897 RepID=UPI00272D85ED|nr:hypothetical protein [Coxiella-like endosymbiont]
MIALRSALFDNLSCINWKRGLIAINGLYQHGFLLALALINEILEKLFFLSCLEKRWKGWEG